MQTSSREQQLAHVRTEGVVYFCQNCVFSQLGLSRDALGLSCEDNTASMRAWLVDAGRVGHCIVQEQLVHGIAGVIMLLNVAPAALNLHSHRHQIITTFPGKSDSPRSMCFIVGRL